MPAVLPLCDVIPPRTTPWVTRVLIAANAVAFTAMALLPGAHEAIVRVDLPPDRWTWATAMTSMFMHASLLHLAGNLAALWLFGDNVEDRFGHGRFLVFYVALGYVTGLAETWAGPASPTPLIGASGAIAGVIGAYLVMFPRSRLLVAVPSGIPPDLAELPAIVFAAGWFLLHGAAGLGRASGDTAFLALFTGTAVGMVGALVLRRTDRQAVDWWGK